MPRHPVTDPACIPFADQARAIVARQEAQRAAHPLAGVSWSGLTRQPPEVERVEDVERQLRDTWAREEAWRASPEGRFVSAARRIAEATGDERLLNCWSNGLDEGTNLDRAALLLDRMEGPAADEARRALAEYATALTVQRVKPVTDAIGALFGIAAE